MFQFFIGTVLTFRALSYTPHPIPIFHTRYLITLYRVGTEEGVEWNQSIDRGSTPTNSFDELGIPEHVRCWVPPVNCWALISDWNTITTGTFISSLSLGNLWRFSLQVRVDAICQGTSWKAHTVVTDFAKVGMCYTYCDTCPSSLISNGPLFACQFAN